MEPPRSVAPAAAADSTSGLEQAARPLLELMQAVSHLETTFITHIDWEAQNQEVLFALNTGALVVAEGSNVDWSGSMCRWVFLSGDEQSTDVRRDFPGSLGGDKLGMQTFFAVPILADDRTIGTVCGASRRVVEIDAATLDLMRLVAKAIAHQVTSERESRAHQDRADRAEVLALTDPLTGLPNRRAFTSRWEAELAQSGRHHYAMGLLAIDVDDFKAVNDTHGHQVGDAILVAVATAMTGASRAGDLLARLGGDEFALATPHTGAAGATRVAQRLRRDFADLARDLGVECSLSIGVSAAPATPRRSLLAAADCALYRSKQQGRDRVEVSTPDSVDRASA